MGSTSTSSYWTGRYLRKYLRLGAPVLRAGALVEQPDTSLKKSSTAISREALGPTEDYSGSVSCRYSRWYYSASRL